MTKKKKRLTECACCGFRTECVTYEIAAPGPDQRKVPICDICANVPGSPSVILGSPIASNNIVIAICYTANTILAEIRNQKPETGRPRR